MSKPRGGRKKYGHKGGSRHFTSFEELMAQQEEVEKARHNDDKENAGGADKEVRVMNFDQPRTTKDESGSSTEESEDDEEDDEHKHKGVSHLIDVENPNRRVTKSKKVTELNVEKEKPEISRREKEALQKEQARQHYLKLHAEGKTEEARSDLARLAIIRKQREEAAKKRQEDTAAKEAKKAPKS